MALFRTLEQGAVALLATSTLVVEMIVVTRLGTDIALNVTTAFAGASHLVAAFFLDKRGAALVAFADEGSRHSLFYLPPQIDTSLDGCLLTGFRYVCFVVTKPATRDFAVVVSATELPVDVDRRVLLCIATKGAVGEVGQFGHAQIGLLFNSIDCRSQFLIQELLALAMRKPSRAPIHGHAFKFVL